MDQKTSYQTVDEYIALQASETREKLERLRTIIRKAAPGAAEVISYQMPGYKQNGMVAWFAAAKHHYALYVSPRVMQPFITRLKDYSLTKSAIHFPLDHDAPEALVTDIIHYSIRLNEEKKSLKSAPTKPKK